MRKFRTIFAALLVIAAIVSCEDETAKDIIDDGNGDNNGTENVVPSDPDNNQGEGDNTGNEGEGDNNQGEGDNTGNEGEGDNNQGEGDNTGNEGEGDNTGNEPEPEPQPEYVVDEHGYATFTHQGFNFKIKESDYNSSRKGKDAVKYIKEDLDHIVSIIPEEALEVMRKRPIWLEKNNTANSSAAWYHTWAGYPESIGDLKEKGKCVEITNYSKYISWSDQNQPLMVLHELCHLYHDQGLGGDRNQEINKAYKNAKDNGLYTTGWYRANTKYTSQSQWTKTTDVYCMVTVWEYFAELCEAYWGENDYYPFNYEQLKEHDPVGFAMMESIWGAK
ncbi:MAG: hypothetical protein E7071_05945 [Bacteroidales bacterium]|nr:hypothetical protein [Bacteroidales bacterium]